MKNYTITVNGNVYEVTVEETGTSGSAERPAALAPAPKKEALPPAQTEARVKGGGRYQVEAGAAGKVVRIEAPVGESVGKGDAVVVMESMKMEIPMVAPEAGRVVSIDVAVGDMVEAGRVLATID